MSKRHLIIPDTQVKPGVPTHHLRWVGQYIVDKQPEVVVHLGDHWDMESLSLYDRGKKCFEGRRYRKDIESGNRALDVLMTPIHQYNDTRRQYKEKQYKPRLVLLRGNHEERILRAIEADPILEGTIGYQDFNDHLHGWEVHEFREPVTIDGIVYCHYFYQPMTGRPYGGTAHTKLKNIGCTFTQGHVQGLDAAHAITPDGKRRRGLVAGSCYLHDESYKGPQANHHWRGILMKHEVNDGYYDLMEVSLDYLCRRYEGVTLADFMAGLKAA